MEVICTNFLFLFFVTIKMSQQYDEETINMLKELMSRLGEIINSSEQQNPNILNDGNVALVATPNKEGFETTDYHVFNSGMREIDPGWLRRRRFRGRVWFSPYYNSLRRYFNRARWVYYVYPGTNKRYYVLLA